MQPPLYYTQKYYTQKLNTYINIVYKQLPCFCNKLLHKFSHLNKKNQNSVKKLKNFLKHTNKLLCLVHSLGFSIDA